MQEEVTQKSIAISIQVSKLTASVLQKALKKLLSAGKNKLQQPHKGKQTLRQLMKQNAGVSNIEITNDNIKAFEQTAKKYGIDFALKKDISADPSRYMVFFKGRDADVLTAAFKEFSAKNLDKEKKPSLRKALAQAREKAKQKTRQREKVKSKDKGAEL
ncbi:MAG: PcfB family protein [Christensenellales bacterium]|jgi:chemotaxis receptor (MCP) glutamine deamidase CheD